MIGMIDLARLRRELDGPPAEHVPVSRRYLRAVHDELAEARALLARERVARDIGVVQDQLLGGGA